MRTMDGAADGAGGPGGSERRTAGRGARGERQELCAELDQSLGPAARGSPEGTYAVRVAGVSGADVIVELGPREQGLIPLAEFSERPAPGAELRAKLVGREDGLWLFSLREARALAAWNEIEVGSLVKATVVGLNKGGLELKIGSLPAFMPASQVALRHVEDLAAYGGQTLVCEVLEVDRERRRVVLSRRAVLESERERARDEAGGALAKGAVLRGKVTRLEPFGAFVQVAPGIEGLLHVSQIAHRRIERPDELLSPGQDVEVLVLELEVAEGKQRISLGMKQLAPDPWDGVAARIHPDGVFTGTVRRVTDFGAFVELEPGIEGLLHVSQMDSSRVRRPRDAVQVGQQLPVRVLSLDPAARRIALSRLDARGALLGSDEALESAEVAESLKQTSSAPLATNLGALFKKALGAPGPAQPPGRQAPDARKRTRQEGRPEGRA
jgi:ribosomal protein S1